MVSWDSQELPRSYRDRSLARQLSRRARVQIGESIGDNDGIRTGVPKPEGTDIELAANTFPAAQDWGKQAISACHRNGISAGRSECFGEMTDARP